MQGWGGSRSLRIGPYNHVTKVGEHIWIGGTASRSGDGAAGGYCRCGSDEADPEIVLCDARSRGPASVSAISLPIHQRSPSSGLAEAHVSAPDGLQFHCANEPERYHPDPAAGWWEVAAWRTAPSRGNPGTRAKMAGSWPDRNRAGVKLKMSRNCLSTTLVWLHAGLKTRILLLRLPMTWPGSARAALRKPGPSTQPWFR